MQQLAIANDHAAVEMKNAIKAAFPDIQWEDVGAQDPSVSVDYPDYGYLLGELIARGDVKTGVALCGSGIGISIALNRNLAVRAALCHDITTAQLSRQHNDANVLVLGARIISTEMAIECVRAFLSTEFEGGRHTKRVEKLSAGC